MDPKDLQIENLMVENSELKIDLEVMATCLRNVKREAEEKIAGLEAVLNESSLKKSAEQANKLVYG